MTLVHRTHPRRRALRRSITAMLAVGAVTAALTGCSAGSSADSGSKTVTFLSWDNAATMKPVVAAFEKANPGYTANLSYAPPVPQYIQKLQTLLGSGTAPDVFIITAENKTQIMNGGFAKDLSKESWTGNLADAAKATYTKDGKLYGAATSSWGGGLLVNKQLLAKVGATSAPATWDDFLALCKKLKAAGITPFYEGGDGMPVSLAALVGAENASLGGKMDDQIWSGKTTFEKTWTPSVKAWSELFDQGLESRSVAGLTGDQVTQQFEQGKVAMIGTGSWALGGIQQSAPDLDLEYWPVPTPDGTAYWAGAVAPGYAINAKAKDPVAAEKFVSFLQSKEGVEVFQKQTAAITTTADFQPKLDASLDQMTSAVRKGDFYLPAVSWPDHSDVMSTQATALLQQLIAGKISPKDVTEGLDQKLQSVK
ncbi:ABC transporter substrate-binding protein [Curtobacterium sp. AB451]|uniref:ABC transporter substrate-binding protein n=1 Tax=unclassified Curtobacterium TaxID=257496 RepID=UPI003A806794